MIIFPRNDLEKQKILEKVASKFEKGKEYSESDVDAAAKSFEVDDYSLVRRELVNFGYLGRDPLKGIYWLKKEKLSKEEIDKIGKTYSKVQKILEE